MTTENTKSEKESRRLSKETRSRSLLAHLKQVLWALLLVYIILLGLVFLFGKEVGYELSLWVCLAVAGLVTVAFFSIYLCDLLRIVIVDEIQRGRNKLG
jgi:fatty acid desaturase